MSEENKLALVEASDLSLVANNILNEQQLQILLQATPPQYVKKRPAKGGGKWDYVTGGYVKKVLNLMFGWDWDFEIMDEMIRDGEVIVKGRLTARANDRTIIKTQYGNKEIVYRKDNPERPLSIGNDLKAAATDALKRCAAELGIAADVYNKADFKPVKVATTPISRSTEKERITKFIKRSKTVAQLNQVSEEILTTDAEISNLWHRQKDKIDGKIQ
jgi:recombination DNA repair RAD52 pathway protein